MSKSKKAEKAAEEALQKAAKAVKEARKLADKAGKEAKKQAKQLESTLEKLAKRAQERLIEKSTVKTPEVPVPQAPKKSTGAPSGAPSRGKTAQTPLADRTVVELRAVARERGLTGYSRLSKSQLITLLQR